MTGVEGAQAQAGRRPVHAWIRFWCARESTYSLDESGFLTDPEGFLGSTLNPNARPLEAWDDQACVVLLGEAGIGKSHELRRWHQQCHTPTNASVESWPRFDLGDAQVWALFKEHVVGTRAEWQTATTPLGLSFDGLDEAPDGPRSAAKHLVSRLRELPIERVRLRIACRTAAWMKWVEEELTSLWSVEPVVLALLPLRRRDVTLAAAASGIDADSFLRAVMDRGAQALAAQPLTLDLLLRVFAEGRMPATREDLYRKGLLTLASEPPSRRTGVGPGRLTAHQRLAVAERIAALTLLTGSVAVGIGDESAAGGVLHEGAIVGGTEDDEPVATPVDRAAVRETLDTGLFNGRGAERLGFAHHSFAEFLAASWLARRKFTRSQIYDLIGVPSSPAPLVAPQWHGLAAWLAGMNKDVLGTLLREQPEVLLDIDAGLVSEAQATDLLSAYLHRIEAGIISYPAFRMKPMFRGLDKRGAEHALRECLRDQERSESAGRLALELVRDVGCIGVLEDVVNLALDPQAAIELRAEAAYTVWRIGEAQAKSRLKPLALEPTTGDERDELQGAALWCCWPRHMTCEELLSSLRPRRAPDYAGLYFGFVADEETAAGIAASDLPNVLAWLGQRAVSDIRGDFERLRENAVARAACHLNDPAVASALAEFAIHCIRNHVEVWPRRSGAFDKPRPDPFADPERRRQLIRAIVLCLPRELHRGYLRTAGCAIARPDDLAWLLEQALEAADAVRWAWLGMVAPG